MPGIFAHIMKHFTHIISFLNCIYFWLCWVFIAVHGLSLFAASGGYSPVAV